MEQFSGVDKNRFLLDNPNDLISLEKWQQTVNLLAELFDAPAGFLVQYTQEGFQTTICSQQETNPYPAGIVIEPDVNIFCRKIVETGKELYVGNAKVDPCWDTNPEVHNDGFSSYLGVPVFWPTGEPFGTFCVMDFEVTDYGDTYFKLIHQLKDILESDLTLLDMYNQVQKLAITDSLTHISNRRGFQMLAEQRIKLGNRMKQSLALFYIDVDKFKTINDSFGHNTGDQVLIKVARSLEQRTRPNDIVGRLGGDEFAVLALIDEKESTPQVADSFQSTINQLQDGTLPDFTVAVGFTPVTGKIDIELLLEKADRNMLKNKRR